MSATATPRKSTSRKRAAAKKVARAPKVVDRTTAYARAVVAGRIVAGPWVRLACKRHLNDLKTAAKRGLTWDIAAAEKAISFFPDVLRLDDGRPFVLTGWQEFVVGSLFGWKRGEVRRFRLAFVETGKGSGKTPLAAGIGIKLLCADDEAAAEVYSAATAADQAKICWLDAKRMVERSPALSSRLEVSVASISHPASGSWFKAVSSEHRGLDGKRVHGAIVDELHEHREATVADKMRAGTKARRQALIFEITNSGYDRNTVCWQHHEYSLKVLQGILVNDEWFAYVCALDEGDDWQDPKVWPKANPSLGITINEKYLAEQVREAQGMPSKQNIVKRLNFCIWTEQADRWLDVTAWDEVKAPVVEEELRGRPCYTGLDLSSTSDMCAQANLFPPLESGELWKVVMRYFIPGDNVRQRIERDRVPYDVWIREGHVIATPGNSVDYDYIEASVRADAGKFQVRELAYDRFFAGQLVTHLQAEGLTVVPVGQGFVSMAAPCRELERLVMSRQLAHGGHPVLRWNVSNVAAAQDPAGNLKPDKSKSTERIDGVSAILTALARAIVQPSLVSVYDERGVIEI